MLTIASCGAVLTCGGVSGGSGSSAAAANAAANAAAGAHAFAGHEQSRRPSEGSTWTLAAKEGMVIIGVEIGRDEVHLWRALLGGTR